jgi:hypothetical protein
MASNKRSKILEEQVSSQEDSLNNLQLQPLPQEPQGLNPEDYEVADEAIELNTRNKYAGKPKVRANKSRPLVGSHGPKITQPTFGVVTGVYH